jgi:diaminohydroxyphosphoribosylaminopyrimidine deaminase/5-amino-6-(5-phosphoribosylamino)uracil reductase
MLEVNPAWLARALALAEQSLLITSPNPRVGCVLVGSQGDLLGQGHTQRAGEAHAEVMALRDAAANGHRVAGATAYVTLEPCSHSGRTGPCCDALIAAGIAQVVVSNIDPNPLVAGQGLARLRAAGVEVQVLPANDPLAIQSRELNLGFFSRMLRKTPWVRLKIAASLDGKTALPNGVSQWITAAAARADGHAWRARACAVLTGVGTVRSDNPRLDVRLLETPRQPALVLVDSALETPLNASLFIACRACTIYASGQNDTKQMALEDRGARVVFLPDSHGKVDLAAMLQDLARREVNELHVEAGEKLNGSLIRAGLVDELLLYLAPKFIGQGLGMAQFGPLADLSQALPLEFKSVQPIGPDLRVLARVVGRDSF